MSTSQQDSYAGIVGAINELRLLNNALPKDYSHNFSGVRDAILDIKKEWGNIGTGDYPPGWVPELDDNGNAVGGEWAYYPQEGDLWFDERQGRLMVWIDGDYHQTNGADQLTVISDTQPDTAISGALWYQGSTQTLYLYTGGGWTVVTSAFVSTDQLSLSNDTVADLTATPAAFPSKTGVDTQKELNQWSIDTLEFLNTKIDNSNSSTGATVTVSTSAPTITADGEFWYNSTTLQLYVSVNGVWNESTPDFSQDSEFTTLESDLSTLSSSTATQISGLNTRVTTLENASPTTYSLATPAGLQLVDSDGAESNIAISATGGSSVIFGSNSITFDTSTLQTNISSLQTDLTNKASTTYVDSSAAQLQTLISSNSTSTSTNAGQINDLSNVVAQLPTDADLLSYLELSGGTMTGALNMGGAQINNIASPFLGTDAANRQYVDDFKTFVSNTYATISNTSFSSLDITNTDTTVAGIDFSSSVSTSQQALKLASNASNNVTFGVTNFTNELAWDFGGTEDFCWKHGTSGKQLSVRSSGVYNKNLFITDFVVDVNGNETLVNTINVKDQVTKLTQLISAISTALNDNSTYADFKSDLTTALANL